MLAGASQQVTRQGGPTLADPSRLGIHFYLSSNTTFGDEDDIAIGTKIEDVTLSAGSSTTLRNPGRPDNTDVTIPEGMSGDFYVFVSVRHASSSGLCFSDPDGAYAMQDGPIRVRIHPADTDYDGDGISDLARP